MNTINVFDAISYPVPKTKTTPDKKYSNDFTVLNESLYLPLEHKITVAVFD
jgi:hypothetical protein